MRRRRFLGAAGAGLTPLLLQGLPLAAPPDRRPQDMEVLFEWSPYLVLHGDLRVMASRSGPPPEPYARAVAAYREQQALVPGRGIWFDLEAHIAPAATPEALRGQLRNVFPLTDRSLYLQPMGEAISEAILQAMPAFEKSDWPAVERRRTEMVRPILAGSFDPYRERLLAFMLTALNATDVTLPRAEIHLLDRYINTGHDTRRLQGRFFTVLETERFPPLGLVETVVMLLGRMMELDDLSNSRGALFQLREMQQPLALPNPALLPRAVLYWTAGEAIRRLVDPAHEHVGWTLKIYERAFRPFLPALEEVWNPYLDGKLTLDEALNGMIRRVAGS